MGRGYMAALGRGGQGGGRGYMMGAMGTAAKVVGDIDVGCHDTDQRGLMLLQAIRLSGGGWRA